MSQILAILFSLFTVGAIAVNSDEPLVVQLDNGNQLIGIQLVTQFTETPFFQFRGIPYAKAPEGSLRFQVLLAIFFLIGNLISSNFMVGICFPFSPLKNLTKFGTVYEMQLNLVPHVHN